jgi:hypothetical protein
VLRGGYGLSRDDLAEHRLGRVAQIRRLSDQHLVEHARDRIDVGCRPDHDVARGLLWAHVEGRSDRKAGLGQPRATRGAHRQRDPEVGDYRLPGVNQNVRRLDVAVDDLVAVCVVERTRHRDGDVHGLTHGKLFLAFQLLAQALALHVGHDVVQEGVGLPGVVQRQDVRVLQVGRRLDLGEEALGSHDGGQLGLEHLERDLPLVLHVLGEIDRRHAPLPDLALDDVAGAERRVEAFDGRAGHADPSGGGKRTPAIIQDPRGGRKLGPRPRIEVPGRRAGSYVERTRCYVDRG